MIIHKNTELPVTMPSVSSIHLKSFLPFLRFMQIISMDKLIGGLLSQTYYKVPVFVYCLVCILIDGCGLKQATQISEKQNKGSTLNCTFTRSWLAPAD